MILVYCPKVSSRLKYVLGLLLETLLGVEWELTTQADIFEGYQGARLNYSKSPLAGREVFIHTSGFLEKRGVQPFVPEVVWKDGLPRLFPSAEAACQAGFDLLAASFFLVSRYEEYLPGHKDQHGRFKAEKSFAFSHGFLEIPVVNHYALWLREMLVKQFPGLAFPLQEYVFFPTYDVDVAYAYVGRGFSRGLGATLRSAIQLDIRGLSERMEVVFGKKQDPFDTYDLQLDWHRQFQLKAFYFFLCGEYGPFDKNISFYSTVFQNLVKKISDYAYTGIHPSYASHENPECLSAEVARLSKTLNREVHFSRQHYLKMELPHTYRNLIRNNIDHDFTMGYASQAGFRASIASPHYFYDLVREEQTVLKVFPFAVMDGTLKDYLDLTPEEGVEKVKKLVKAVREVNGTFISLWHNESLCECQRWKGWRTVYERLLEMAAPKPVKP